MGSMEDLRIRFRDRPVTNREFFVDRSKELAELEGFSSAFGDLVGITGERGSGKTSILNQFTPKEGKKIVILIEEKETKLDILIDLAYQLAGYMENDNLFSSLKDKIKQIKHELLVESTHSISKELGVSVGLEGRITRGEAKRESHSIHLVKNKFADLVKLLTSKTKAVLVIDELDKERKEDIARVLDSIKGYLRSSHIVTFISLPPSIFYEYYKSVYHRKEKIHNIENVMDEIVLLAKMTDQDIKQILERRMGKNKIIEDNAVLLILEYADGNPRRALRSIYHLILHGHTKISEKIMRRFLTEELEKQISALELTKKEEQAIQLLASLKSYPYFKKEVDIVNILLKRRIINTKPRGYKLLKQLVESYALIEEKDRLYLPRQLRLYYNLTGKSS